MQNCTQSKFLCSMYDINFFIAGYLQIATHCVAD